MRLNLGLRLNSILLAVARALIIPQPENVLQHLDGTKTDIVSLKNTTGILIPDSKCLSEVGGYIEFHDAWFNASTPQDFRLYVEQAGVAATVIILKNFDSTVRVVTFNTDESANIYTFTLSWFDSIKRSSIKLQKTNSEEYTLTIDGVSESLSKSTGKTPKVSEKATIGDFAGADLYMGSYTYCGIHLPFDERGGVNLSDTGGTIVATVINEGDFWKYTLLPDISNNGNNGIKSTDAIHNPYAVSNFFTLGGVRRVDYAGIGDSNQVLNAYGWDAGFSKKLYSMLPVYATPLFGGQENNGFGVGMGYDCNIRNLGEAGAASNAPVELDQYNYGERMGIGIGRTQEYEFINFGEAAKMSSILAAEGSSFKFPNGFRFHNTLGAFPSNEGSFIPHSRRRGGSWLPLFDLGVTQVPSGNYNLADIYYDHIEDLGNDGVDVALHPISAQSKDVNGNFFRAFQRLEILGQDSGVAHTTIGYRGGEPSRIIAEGFQALTNAAKDELIRQLTRIQNDVPVLMIRICEGMNDRADTNLSVGKNPALGNTKEGFFDNNEVIINEIESAWERLGYNRNNLYFCLTAAHQTLEDDSDLRKFRDANIALANVTQNCSAVDLTKLITFADMAPLYFAGNIGDAHLNELGYDTLASLELEAVLQGVNAVGEVNLNPNGNIDLDAILIFDEWLTEAEREAKNNPDEVNVTPIASKSTLPSGKVRALNYVLGTDFNDFLLTHDVQEYVGWELNLAEDINGDIAVDSNGDTAVEP